MTTKPSVPLDEQIAYCEKHLPELKGDKEHEPLCAAILASLRRVKELEADAGRYQWLRGGHYTWEQERGLRDKKGWLLCDEELDAAVDAARGSEHV